MRLIQAKDLSQTMAHGKSCSVIPQVVEMRLKYGVGTALMNGIQYHLLPFWQQHEVDKI